MTLEILTLEILCNSSITRLRKHAWIFNPRVSLRLHVPNDRMTAIPKSPIPIGAVGWHAFVVVRSVLIVLRRRQMAGQRPFAGRFRLVGTGVRRRRIRWSSVDAAVRSTAVGGRSDSEGPDRFRVGRRGPADQWVARLNVGIVRRARSMTGRAGLVCRGLTTAVRSCYANGSCSTRERAGWLAGIRCRPPSSVASSISFLHFGPVATLRAHGAHSWKSRILVGIEVVVLHFFFSELLGILPLLASPPEEKSGCHQQGNNGERHHHPNRSSARRG